LLLLLVVAAVPKTMLFDLKSVISHLCLLVIHHFRHGFWSWGAKPVFCRNEFHLLLCCCCCCLLLLLLPSQCYLTWNRSSVICVYLWWITFDMAFGAEVPNQSFNRNEFHLLLCCCCVTDACCCCCCQSQQVDFLFVSTPWWITFRHSFRSQGAKPHVNENEFDMPLLCLVFHLIPPSKCRFSVSCLRRKSFRARFVPTSLVHRPHCQTNPDFSIPDLRLSRHS